MAPSYREFALARTTLSPGGLAHEVRLHLATDARGIFQDADELERPDSDRFPPYWAFAWPGGQAMARHILDHPALVRGLRVADIGAGSGIAGIAAALAGAAHVLAVDIDPIAMAAIGLNAAANGCSAQVQATMRDRLSSLPDADLVIIADLVYEPELGLRVDAFLEMAALASMPVLIGDRVSARLPVSALDRLGHYSARLAPELEEGYVEEARVWRLKAARPGRRAREGGVRS